MQSAGSQPRLEPDRRRWRSRPARGGVGRRLRSWRRADFAAGSRSRTSAPTTPSVTASATPTPTPVRTPSPTPKTTNRQQVRRLSFTDCSDSLGLEQLLRHRTGMLERHRVDGDAPWLGELADCNEQHIYQVFAGGQLPGLVVVQSQFEANQQVRRLCSESHIKVVPLSGSVHKDWQLRAAPTPDSVRR